MKVESKRILYITQIDIANNFGYRRKIFNQLKSFNSSNIETYLISKKNNTLIFCKFKNGEINIIKKIILPKINNKYINGYLFNKRIFKFADSAVKENEFDSIYIRRFIPITNFLIKFLKKQNSTIFYEYPTYPWKNEMKKNFNKIEYLMDLLNYKRLIKNIDYLPVVYENEVKADKNEKNKFIKIGNGIDVEEFAAKKNKTSIKDFNIISIANIQKWHGFDRIINSLFEYYKKNPSMKIYYHCIGNGPELKNLKDLAKQYGIEKYIIFYGEKKGKDLDIIIDKCNIAFSSLGLHRIGAGTPLKSREYAARGIPFVYSYPDSDFQNFNYAFKVSNDDKVFDFYDIILFYKSIENLNYTKQMRDFARKKLSWDIKMSPVINKIKEGASK